MENTLPEWASNKVSEGMKVFLDIVNEYGQFDVEFKPLDFQYEHEVGFNAIVQWSPFARPDIVHEVQFEIQHNHEQLYNANNEKVDTWQLVVNESGVTFTGQIFYMQLFHHLDANFSLLVSQDIPMKTKVTSSK